MQNKTILITGAGFSAPANLPIQDKILYEMIEKAEEDFLNVDVEKNSIKFLVSYIEVAIYLLKEYTRENVSEIEVKYNRVKNDYHAADSILKIINFIEENYKDSAEKKDFNLIAALSDTVEKCVIDEDKYYTSLLSVKEEVRQLLQESNLKISLEDVFTSFDKSITLQKNTSNYSYVEIDKLQHSILRLFTYYFSNKVNEHDYNTKDYKEVIHFIKENLGNISILTTNWDILFENYLCREGIKYNYNFNSSYVLNREGNTYFENKDSDSTVTYLKMHGSINWFRCLKCGTLQIYEGEKCGKYLFDDTETEKCVKCGQEARMDNVQIAPEIVTPTMIKSINSQLYNNIWQNAAYELQQAERVVFCGYSLPLADFEFRHLLKQNINKSAKIDVVLYHNDDPDKVMEENIKDLLPEKRYKDLFPNNECEFFYDGFGEFFRKIADE